MRIVFQGDSITDCKRDRSQEAVDTGLGHGYVFMLAARLLAEIPEHKIDILNRGCGGNRILDLYARWKKDTLNLKPDILAITIGVNDCIQELLCDNGVCRKNGVSDQQFEDTYRTILKWTFNELENVKIILGEPCLLETGMVTKEMMTALSNKRKIVKKIAKEFKITMIPFQSIFSELTEDIPAPHWLADGGHPSPAGHYKMMQAWYEQIEKLI